MTGLIISSAASLLALTGYLISIYPGRRRNSEISAFSAWKYAHRGLHDLNSGIPENSCAAFEAAASLGYGVELDVQITSDGQAVVFHDDNLIRMCGMNRLLTESSYSDINILTLANTTHKIPKLTEVLSTIHARVPIIVEIKAAGNYLETCKITDRILSEYKGLYCVESFNPKAVKWYAANRPHILRGQLTYNYMQNEKNLPLYDRVAMTYVLMNFWNRPDFIASMHSEPENLSLKICRRLFHTFMVAWTVTSNDEYEKASKRYDAIIFENIKP